MYEHCVRSACGAFKTGRNGESKTETQNNADTRPKNASLTSNIV